MIELIILGLLSVIGLVISLVIISFFNTWLKAFLAKATVGFTTLLAMRLRGVPVGLIVDARITAVKAGIPLETDQLEAHYLAEGNVVQTVQSLIAASKANIELAWDRACAIDLATRGTSKSVLEAVRTSINPKGVKEIDLKKDNIFFYPIIYWQITKEFIKLDNKSLKKLKSYFDSGGIILFDLVEFSKSYSSLSNNSLYEIKNLFANIGIVNLDLVPKDHTLTKSFYLLSNFPGRWDNRFVLVDLNNLKTKDGVSSVIIGLNDWAGAWAKDENSFPIYQAIPGGERQRELAYRFGINVIMYALTGNYKSDQVHSRSILDRLRKK